MPGQRLAVRAVAGAPVHDGLDVADRGLERLAAQQRVAVVLHLVLLDHGDRAGLAARAQPREHERLHRCRILQAFDGREVHGLVLGRAAHAPGAPVELERDVAARAVGAVVERVAPRTRPVAEQVELGTLPERARGDHPGKADCGRRGLDASSDRSPRRAPCGSCRPPCARSGRRTPRRKAQAPPSAAAGAAARIASTPIAIAFKPPPRPRRVPPGVRRSTPRRRGIRAGRPRTSRRRADKQCARAAERALTAPLRPRLAGLRACPG